MSARYLLALALALGMPGAGTLAATTVAAPVASATSPAPSPATATARAAVTVLRPITVVPVAELSFGKLVYAGQGLDGYVLLPAKAPSERVALRVNLLPGGGESALARELTGEPRRVYRVSIPATLVTSTGNLLVHDFSLWSGQLRDITATRLGAFDAQGNDTLRIGATLIVPKGTRQGVYAVKVPVTIAYE